MPRTEHKIVLENVRLSFAQLFVAKQMTDDPNSKAKFSASFLMDPSKPEHAAKIREVEALMKACAEEKWGVGKVPRAVKYCLHDGNEKDYEGYAGMMYVSSSSDRRPVTVDRRRNVVVEADGVLYSGCYVNASLRFWAQDNQYGKRVNCELKAVQFVQSGEAFGAAPVDPEREFADLVPEDADDFLN
jgi:hypothetical protein